MDYRLLGPIEAVHDDGTAAPLSTRQRTILGVLALRANQTVPADILIEVVWGERPPPSASSALRVALSDMRRALEPTRDRGSRSLIEHDGNGWQLHVGPDERDIDRFSALRDRADGAWKQGDAHTALVEWRDAAALWRGVALADLRDRWHVASARAVGLDEELIGLRERIAAALLATGEPERAIPDLRSLVDAHPYREGAVVQLMTALYRTGRQADALTVATRCRLRLAEDLGLRPGPALEACERAVLTHDPRLSGEAHGEARTEGDTEAPSEMPSAEPVLVPPRPPRSHRSPCAWKPERTLPRSARSASCARDAVAA